MIKFQIGYTGYTIVLIMVFYDNILLFLIESVLLTYMYTWFRVEHVETSLYSIFTVGCVSVQ